MAVGYENYGNDPYDEDTQQALMEALRRNPALGMPTQGQPQRGPVRRPAQGQMADPDAPLPEPWKDSGYQPNAGVPADAPLRPVTSADVPLGQRSRLPLATAAARSTTAGATQRQQASDTALKAFNLMEKPVDVAAMEEAARARNEAASGDMGAGIIMSALGGKAFSPIGGHILTQAIKAKQPYDVPGGYGTMEGGKFIPNEFKMREQELSRLTALANFYETQAAHANTEEERERNNRLADETRRYAIEQQAENNRLTRAGIDQRTREVNQARIDRDNERKAADKVKRVDAIRKEYNALAKSVSEGSQFAVDVIKLLGDPNISRNAPGQVALIMQFGKMLDPDSVVREAEQRMIEQARGVFGDIMQWPERIRSGARLNKEQLDFMRQIAIQFEQGAKGRQQALQQRYVDIAKRGGLTVEDLGFDPVRPGGGRPPGAVVPDTGQPPGAATPGGAVTAPPRRFPPGAVVAE